MNKLNETKLVELLADKQNAIAMGPFGSRIKAENFVSSGIPVIKGGNLGNCYLKEDQFDFLTPEKAEELKSSKAVYGDIVITHRGTLGQVGLIHETSKYEEYIVSQSQLKVSPNKEKIDPYYLYYFLISPLGQHRLLENSSQVGVPAIARASTSVKEILVPVPSLNIQKKIVELLRNLDKKIELNQKMNETLEEIAKTLFKSWFIDFDPVRAKAEGRPTGLSKEISDLFPDSFEDSELGEIPRGWKIKKVGECLEFIYGKGLTKKQRIHGDIPVYGSNGIVGFHNNANAKGPGIVVGRAGNPGTVHWSFKDFFVIDSAFSVNVIDEEMSNFYFYALKNLRLERLNSGSAIPGLNRNHAYEEKIIIPNLPLLREFNTLSSSFFSKQLLTLEENEVLSQLRDKLLPRLISGELQITDAENLVEEAGI